MNPLIAYFTHPGESYVNGKLMVLETGNTQRTAQYTREITGGNLYRIETRDAYPESYMDLIRKARREKEEQARPALKGELPDLSTYDCLILEYPNWWSTCPMPVLHFLEQIEPHGMDILPLCTHEGSGLADSVRDIQAVCPDCRVLPGLAVHGAEARESRETIEHWLKPYLN